MSNNTLFLRLEGPLQAWGNHESKFVVRRTYEAPTRSGIIGMLLAAKGISRSTAREWFQKLKDLKMAVRIDRPGVRWWDYHTVGAGIGMTTAGGGLKTGAQGTLITRREYLADASFLVALQGKADLVDELHEAMQNPKWPPYLGRKCCPPSCPVLDKEHQIGDFSDLLSALKFVPWRKRLEDDKPPATIACLIDWQPTPEQPEAPEDAEVWYDVPYSFDPPAHEPRFVIRKELSIDGDVQIAKEPAQHRTPSPPRPRADYDNSEYKKARENRLALDHHLCVFCKSPATTVQHITYRRAGGNETPEDLRSLCRLCHDAVTMLEYGAGMGLDRINPEDPKWREKIIEKRNKIIEFRSLETRHRGYRWRLKAEEEEEEVE